MTKIAQNSFSSGELTPSLHNKPELEKYLTGLRTCYNSIIHTDGGVSNRAGTEFITEIKDSSKAARLIPFAFNTTDTYALLFGDYTLWLIRDGALVYNTDETITGITQADPAVVTVTGHPYNNGDVVRITEVVGMVELNGNQYVVANKTANTFELTDREGNNIDSSAFSAYSSGGTVNSVYEVTTPYAAEELAELNYTQSADVITLVHPSYAPRELSRSGALSWSLSTISFSPTVQPPTGLTGTGTAYNYVVTSYYDDTEEESVASASASMDETNALSWTAPASGPTPDRYYVYKEKPANGVYGFIGEAVGTSFTDSTITPDLEDTPPQARNPFSSTDNYPSVVAYFQQRLAFGASNNHPNKIWFTQTGRFNNLNVSVPQKPDDAITISISANEVNRIRSFAPLSDLITITAGAEHLITAGDNPFTIDNIKIKPQDYRGANKLKPIILGGDILFNEEEGNVVRSMTYSLEDDAFKAQDLSVLSKHLFVNNELLEWSYASQPNNIVWAVRDDGILLGFTFVREHNVFAWHWHETDGDFESTCTVKENKKSASYFIVEREINNKTVRYVERMHERGFEGRENSTEIEEAFFIDSGLTYDDPYDIAGATVADPVVVTVTSHPYSNGDVVHISNVVGMTELNGGRYIVASATANTFELTDLDGADIDGSDFSAWTSGGKVRLAVQDLSGLEHLEGETVSILADGDVHPQRTVTNGAVSLDYKAARVHVGLPFNSDVETLETPQGQGRNKTASRVKLRIHNTRGLSAGPSLDKLKPLKQRTNENWSFPTRLTSGEVEITIDPSWKNKGRLSFRQSDPLPFTILSIIPDYEAGG